jgi:phosphopantetheinyl transferase
VPLFQHIKHSKQTEILVWKITETETELSEGLSLTENSKNRLNGMQSETHRKGYLSVRKLLELKGYTDTDLFYTSDGKPHLKDGKKISITHSFDFSAFIISTHTVGIDIEMNREKIQKIAPKFISKEAEFMDKTDPVRFLTVVWGAKESLYKIHPDGGLLFKEHLPIEPFSLNQKKTRGWIKKDSFYEVYDVFFRFLESYTLVYAVND